MNSGTNRPQSKSNQRLAAKRGKRRLFLENLESRDLLATFTWTGAASGNWSAAGNWSLTSGTDAGTAGIPDSGDTAVFSTTAGNKAITLDIAGTTNLAGFQVAGANTSDYTFTAPLGNDLSITGSYSISGSGNVSLNIPLGGNNATVAKAGSGTLSLLNFNSYGGGTSITGGVLESNGFDTIPDVGSVDISSGATYRVSASESLNNITGLGTVDLNGAGVTLTIGASLGAGTFDTLDAVFTGAGKLSFAPSGPQSYILTGTNSFSGGITGNDNTRIVVANTSALGTGTLTMGNVSALTSSDPGLGFFFPDNTDVTVANNIVFGNQSFTIGMVDPIEKVDNVSVTLTGVLSGGAAGNTIRFDSDQPGNHTNTFKLTNNANSFQGFVQMFTGSLAISGDGALGNSSNSVVIQTRNEQGRLIFLAPTTLSATRQVSLLNSSTSPCTFDTNGNDVTIASTLANSGQLVKVGLGKLTLTGTNTYTGKTIIKGGVLQIDDEARLGGLPAAFTADQLTLNGGTLEVTATAIINDTNRGVTVAAGGGTIDVDTGTTLTLAVPLAGTGVLTKADAGKLIINSTVTHSGDFNITGGDVQVGTGGATGLLGTGKVDIGAGRTLEINRNSTLAALSTRFTGNGTLLVSAGNVTLSNATSKVSNLVVAGTATVNATNPIGVTTSYSQGGTLYNVTSGTLNVAGATLATSANLSTSDAAIVLVPVGAPAAFSSPNTKLTVTGTASLDLANTTSVTLGQSTVTSGTLALNNSNNVTYTGAVTGAGGLIKRGAGQLTLASASTFGGTTTIEDGTLILGSATTLPTTTTVVLGTATTNGTLDLNGLSATVADLQVAAGATAASQQIGNGSTTSDATLTLAGPFSATGFNGVLKDVVGSGTKTLSVVKSGTGKLILGGANTYTGTTTVSSGTLALNGSLTTSGIAISSGAVLSGAGTTTAPVTSTGGVVAPGDSVGALSVGNLSLDAASTFKWEMQSPYTTAGTDYDRLNVVGTVALGGAKLDITGLSLSSAPNDNDKFVIISNDGTDAIPDTFAGLAEGATFTTTQGYRFTISYKGGLDSNDVELTAAPRLPLVVDDTYLAFNEDTTLTVNAASGVLTNDVIYSGVTAAVVDQPLHGKLTFNADGSFVYVPNADYNGPDSFTYKAVSAGGLSSPTNATVSLQITNVEDPPVITSNGGGDTAAVTIPENTTQVTTVTATDADTGSTVTFSIDATQGADRKLFVIDSKTGQLSFQTAPNFEAPTDANTDNKYEVVVVATDNTNRTDKQTLTVTVSNVNETPSITSLDTFTLSETAPLTVTVTATDPDNVPTVTQQLTYSIIGGTDSTKLNINATTGALTFKAGGGDFDAPVDSDGDNVYVVAVQVSDGAGGTAAQTVTITITGEDDNDPIISTKADITLLENLTSAATVAATDADLPAQTLTYSISGGADAADFAIDASTGELTFVTPPDYEAPSDANLDNIYIVAVDVSDGTAPNATRTFTITVTPDNDNLPQFTTPDNYSVVENTSAVGTVAATDADLPTPTVVFSIVDGDDAALFTITSAGVLSFKTAPDFDNPSDANHDNKYIVEVQADDGTSGINSQVITVTVTNVNEGPVIKSNGGGVTANVNVAENTTAVTTVIATNELVAPAQFRIIGGADASFFTINATTGKLAFKVAPDFESPADANGDNVYVVQVEAFDTTPAADSQTINVNVTNVFTTSLVISTLTGGQYQGVSASSRNDNLTISRVGTNIVITDNTPDLDSVIDLVGVTGTGDLTKSVSIPFANVEQTVLPFLLSLGGGDDVLQIDTDGAASDPIPLKGYSVDFGTGNDSFDLIDNSTTNAWTLSGAQSGNVQIGTLGTVTFSGVEKTIGGSGLDDFNITNTAAVASFTINGDTGSNLDSVTVSRDANFVLTNTSLKMTAGSVNQTYSMANITRAFLTGGAAANTFDVSGWTSSGDGTAANAFGGRLTANGGVDTVIKKGEINNFVADAGRLTTSDNMVMLLAGVQSFNLEDTNGSTPTKFDVSNWSWGGTVKAGNNPTDQIYMSSGFSYFTLSDTQLKVNTRPAINMTGVNTGVFIGRAADQKAVFTNFAWTGTTSFDGGDGTDTVVVDRDSDYVVKDDVITAGNYSVSIANTESFVADAGAADNTIDITQWTKTGIVRGQNGTGDKLIVAGDTDITLNGGSIVFGTGATARTVQITTTESVEIRGGSSNNAIKLNSWAGAATIDGGGGTDSLTIFRNSNFILEPSKATVAGQVIAFSNVENLTLTGGDAANSFVLKSGYNTNLSSVALKPGAGFDTVAIEENANFQVTQNGTTSLNIDITPVGGPLKSLSFGAADIPETINLTGGAADNVFTFLNYLGGGTINGAAGNDQLNVTSSAPDFELKSVTTPAALTTLRLSSKTLTLVNLEDANLTGSTGANTFSVDGWKSPLSIAGLGGGDTLTMTSGEATVTVTDTTIARTGAGVTDFTGIQSLVLNGRTGTSQTYDLSAWTGNGTLNAGDGVDKVVMSKDTDMTLNNARLIYGTGTAARTWSLTGVDQAALTGGASANFLNGSGFSGDQTINGGDGNDTLWGGSANDLLNGGLGDDWISGNDGNDTLIGGEGKDVLVGGRGVDILNPTTTVGSGNGDDIIIGTYTSYDTTKSAIDEIMKVWAGSDTYTNRIHSINVSGVGASSNIYLRISTAGNPVAPTLFEDSAVDTLFGGAGTDWFFAKDSAGTGKETGLSPSKIDNLASETVTKM